MDLADLREHGFQIIPNAFSNPQCDFIIGTIETSAVKTNSRQPHLRFPEIQTALLNSPLARFFRPPWKIIRSIHFDKTPDANWSVPWHQDLTICVNERRDTAGFGPWSVKDGLHHVHVPAELLDQIITIRIHLDDCGADNGPLRVIPHTHGHGRLTEPQNRTIPLEGLRSPMHPPQRRRAPDETSPPPRLFPRQDSRSPPRPAPRSFRRNLAQRLGVV